MKKLSKFTRLPFIPEINKPPVLANLAIIGLFCLFSYYIIYLEKKNLLWILLFLLYHVIVYYSPRIFIAKDLFFRNMVEFTGEIEEVIKSNRENYSTEIKIHSSENISQNLDQNFLLLSPSTHRNMAIFQRLKPSKKLFKPFDTDCFLYQKIIFRSFQHSAFIFDLGIILADQLNCDVSFFFYHLEYLNDLGKKQTLKYKRIEQVKHHINFKDRSHIVKLISPKAEFTFICDETQFTMLRQFLYSSDISF